MKRFSLTWREVLCAWCSDLRDIKGAFTVCTLCNYSDLSLIPVG